MMRFIFLFAVLLNFAWAEQPLPQHTQECSEHVPYGIPGSNKNISIICRGAYLLIYDNDAKIPIIASYLLEPKNVVSACNDRDNSFEIDKSLLPLYRSNNKDYAKSGYDIGHMVNAEDLKYSADAQRVAAILSNAAPQLPQFNRGIWKKLEDTSRGWAISKGNPILVYVGPIYNKAKNTTIGNNKVIVPYAFFKILIDIKTEETQVFLFEHKESKADLDSFLTSITRVQKHTGIVFPLPKKPKFTRDFTWDIVIKSSQVAKREVCSLR